MAYKEPQYFYGSSDTGTGTHVTVAPGGSAIPNPFGFFQTVRSNGEWVKDTPDDTLFLPGGGLYLVSMSFLLFPGPGGNTGDVGLYAMASNPIQLLRPFDLTASGDFHITGTAFVDDGDSFGFEFDNSTGTNEVSVVPHFLSIFKLF